MEKDLKLVAKTRDPKLKNLKTLRSKNFITVNLYGPGAKNRNLIINKANFEKIFKKAGESSLINLEIDGKKSIKTIVKEVQRNPIKGNYLNVDLYLVDMNKKISTEIPLNYIGESKAVNELGAILVKNMDHIKVECLPGDLVEKIDVELTSLINLNDFIKIEEINLPAGISYMGHKNDILASVIQPKEEKEEAPAEAIAEEEKKDEAAEAEGEGEKQADEEKEAANQEKK